MRDTPAVIRAALISRRLMMSSQQRMGPADGLVKFPVLARSTPALALVPFSGRIFDLIAPSYSLLTPRQE